VDRHNSAQAFQQGSPTVALSQRSLHQPDGIRKGRSQPVSCAVALLDAEVGVLVEHPEELGLHISLPCRSAIGDGNPLGVLPERTRTTDVAADCGVRTCEATGSMPPAEIAEILRCDRLRGRTIVPRERLSAYTIDDGDLVGRQLGGQVDVDLRRLGCLVFGPPSFDKVIVDDGALQRAHPRQMPSRPDEAHVHLLSRREIVEPERSTRGALRGNDAERVGTFLIGKATQRLDVATVHRLARTPAGGIESHPEATVHLGTVADLEAQQAVDSCPVAYPERERAQLSERDPLVHDPVGALAREVLEGVFVSVCQDGSRARPVPPQARSAAPESVVRDGQPSPGGSGEFPRHVVFEPVDREALHVDLKRRSHGNVPPEGHANTTAATRSAQTSTPAGDRWTLSSQISSMTAAETGVNRSLISTSMADSSAVTQAL